MKKIVILALLLTAALVDTSTATLVSVDIGTGPLFIGTGVEGGGTWNAMDHGGQSSNLLDSTGAASAITFYLYSLANFVDTTGGTVPADNPDTAALLEDYGETAFNNNVGLTISGLVPLQTYDLTIYAAGSDGVGDIFNANFPGTTTGSSRGAFISGDNYLRHLITADSNGIFFTGAGGTNGSTAVINGFQISTVPEPSTWALLAVGAVALCGVAKRRTASPARSI